MKNPFDKIKKKTDETALKWETKENSSIETKTCKTCGAPRPKNTNIVICDFCGNNFMNMNTQKNIK